MAEIRLASKDDIARIVAIGQDMQQESPRFSRLGYDCDKVRALLNHMVESDNCVVLVACQGGVVIGMLMGYVGAQFFSNALTGHELVVYLMPEHRGGTAVVRMLKEFEKWAFGQGAKEILLGVSTEVDASRTSALYERLGYVPSGCTLVKRCA